MPAKTLKKSYSRELADELLLRYALGETVSAIIRSDPDHFPSRASIWRWRVENLDGYRDRFDEAREQHTEALWEESIDILRSTEGIHMPVFEKGLVVGRKVDSAEVQRRNYLSMRLEKAAAVQNRKLRMHDEQDGSNNQIKTLFESAMAGLKNSA